MRVDPGEVELSRNEEEHGAHGREAGVAACLALGGLEETVQGFDEAIGLAGLGPGNDAVEVRSPCVNIPVVWFLTKTHPQGTVKKESHGRLSARKKRSYLSSVAIIRRRIPRSVSSGHRYWEEYTPQLA